MRNLGAVLAMVLALLGGAGQAHAQIFWPWQQVPQKPPQAVQKPQRQTAPKPSLRPRRDVKRAQPKPADAKPAAPVPGVAALPPAAQPVPEGPPPVYEPQLLRLSEVLGALAFLRPLCGGGDEAEWRNRMDQLIQAEASTPQRRERLAGAWNRGYRSSSLTYRRCTPNAELLIGRYLDEGSRLARELVGRYGA